MTRFVPSRDGRARSRPRIAANVFLLGVAALGLATTTSIARSPNALPSAGSFKLAITHRIFDGVNVDSVVLASGSVSMMTDTFGSWIAPDDTQGGGSQLTLRNKRFDRVRLDICRIAPTNVPAHEQDWEKYVSHVLKSLGPEATVTDEADSTKGPPAIAVIGWPTREALFIQPPSASTTAMAERHVLACGNDGAVLFVLSGPYDQVTRANDDFRFFLSRLTRY